MPSERVQRVINGYLDEIEVAAKDGRWNDVSELANTILELDDTNDDAQTFLKLAVSKSGSQETQSVNESVTKNKPIQEVVTDHENLNLSQESGPVINEFTRHILDRLLREDDQVLIDIVARDLKSIDEASTRGGFMRSILGSEVDSDTYTRLRFIHLLIPLRKQDLPEGSESPLNNESVLDSLEHWYEDNQTDSNFRQKSLEGWKFDLSGMTKYVEEYYEAFKNPTVPSKKKIEPVAEPTSDYWKTRQEVTPLANQDSGTSSSSDSLTDVEEESSSWMTYILYFVVAAVIGVIILVLLGVSLPEGGGGTAIMRFLVIPPIVWGLVWLVGKFKS